MEEVAICFLNGWPDISRVRNVLSNEIIFEVYRVSHNKVPIFEDSLPQENFTDLNDFNSS